VRVSLKGWDEGSFERISGAQRSYFELPLRGLRNLLENGGIAWPAIMYDVFHRRGIEEVTQSLTRFGIKAEELVLEYLEPYPFVLENLKKRWPIK
jgi:uncharacterized Fe-S cluster-containing radical SAM superfamily protein